MSIRHLRFGSYEHSQREIRAVDVREVGNGHMVYGDGKHVCRVIKCRRLVDVGVIGEDGLNEFGAPFCYDDYFAESAHTWYSANECGELVETDYD